MSSIEDRDEQAYLNGFEEPLELHIDWDSEEVRGIVKEYRVDVYGLDGGEIRRFVVKRLVAKMYGDTVDEEQPELPYDWDSEEAQGTKDQLIAEQNYLTPDQIEAAAKALRDEKANRVDTYHVPEWENTSHGDKIVYRGQARAALEAYKLHVNTIYGIQSRA